MFQDPVVAAMVILGLIAVGEVISILTKARIPMLFIALMGYLVLIWTGILPKSMIVDSGFVTVGTVLGTAPIIVHMGTLIPLKSIKSQWRAVAIAVLGIIFASVLILTIVTFIFDYSVAVAGVGPLTGGIIALLVTSEGLAELGLVSLVTIPVLIMAIQSLFGIPIATNILRKYALKIRSEMDNGTYVSEYKASDNNEKENDKFFLPDKFRSNLILLFLLFVGGALAVVLGKYTPIPYSLWALVIGVLGRLIGFYPERVMERANAFTVGMAGIIFLIIIMMNDITFGQFIGYLPEVLSIMVVGIIGIIVGGYIGSKIFKWDPLKGIPVALTATFGFPGDYIVCEEVSRSVGRDKEEEEKIFNEILTPMLVGGFTTVTVGSVIIASILIKTL
ncbi:hypothetical protein [Psychrobacillus sp. FJAT-21963]|uniref:hypothetical protein n=1 Tax=Psychrobacillus sp. FJAT-21963 TaxID=1712028 RepID=UPI0006F48D1E|nr:hypothetical protein [Psychrobacillus sp. FJAT-21963]KQL34065.1 hypothetical protein AN959_13635 [Psychrobacillus sp. FJAT-21963]